MRHECRRAEGAVEQHVGEPGLYRLAHGAAQVVPEPVVHDGVARIPVKTSTVPPQMFRENIGVVVEGTMVKGGYFQSNRLMVSHNNEYKAPEKGHPVDRKELERMMKSVAENE